MFLKKRPRRPDISGHMMFTQENFDGSSIPFRSREKMATIAGMIKKRIGISVVRMHGQVLAWRKKRELCLHLQALRPTTFMEENDWAIISLQILFWPWTRHPVN